MGEIACDACGKALRYHVEFPAAGVKLTLCGGCAGEAQAFAAFGDEAVCEHDWPAIRERVGVQRG